MDSLAGRLEDTNKDTKALHPLLDALDRRLRFRALPGGHAVVTAPGLHPPRTTAT